MDNVDRIRELATKHKATLDSLLTEILRSIFVPRSPDKVFVVCDATAIEARGLAWAADDHNVDIFREGGDVYLHFASKLFGIELTGDNKADKTTYKRERSVAKVAELSCGYGCGGPTFGVMCRNSSIDLRSAGFDSPWQVVWGYRDAHPRIAGVWDGEWYRPNADAGPSYRVYRGGFWRELHAAAMSVVQGRESVAYAGHNNAISFFYRGPDLIMRLPSGRELVYLDCRLERVLKSIGGGEPLEANAIVYTKEQSESSVLRSQMYPGKWAENAIQAICWDVLNEVHVEVEEYGWPVVFEAHDEIVLEVPRSEAEAACRWVCHRMAQSPQWAADWPLASEGFVAEYYTKKPEPDWFQYEVA